MSELTSRSPKPRKKKRNWLRILVILTTLFLVWWFNNFTVRINKNELKSSKISETIRIAVMSDYHSGDTEISRKRILRKLKKIKPDIVFYVGDMYTKNTAEFNVDNAADLMIETASLGYPTYFVSGEHDRKESYLTRLRNGGVNVMDYKSDVINIKGQNIAIYGIDNAYFSDTFRLTKEFQLQDSRFNILLAHIPQYRYYAAFGADLTVCGDSHGGIIQIPFIGPAYDNKTNQWFPKRKNLGAIYDKGFFDYNGGTMFVTSGIGTQPAPARFNNRPEIAVIELKPE